MQALVKMTMHPLADRLHSGQFSAVRPSQALRKGALEVQRTDDPPVSDSKPNQNLIRRFNLKVEPEGSQVDGP